MYSQVTSEIMVLSPYIQNSLGLHVGTY